MFMLLNFIPTVVQKYAIIGIVFCACVIGAYFYGASSTKQTAVLECQNEQQHEQIQIQNANIQYMQKAKQISRVNADLERDQLIDDKL